MDYLTYISTTLLVLYYNSTCISPDLLSPDTIPFGDVASHEHVFNHYLEPTT